MNVRTTRRSVVSTMSVFAATTIVLAIVFLTSTNPARVSSIPKNFDAQLAVFRGNGLVTNFGSQQTPRAETSNNGVGWVLTNGGLEVTTNNGATFQTIEPPVTTANITDVSIEGEEITITSVVNGVVTIVTSSNSGSSWSSDSINANQPDAANAQIVANAGVVLGVFVTNQSNVNFSSGEWFSTSSNGTWVENGAPAGGGVTYLNGKLWLVGGPIETEVFVSGNDGLSWSTVAVPPSVTSSQSALAIPGEIEGSSVVLVATRSPQTSTEGIGETVYTSDDEGETWSVLGNVSFDGDVGVGVPAPTEVVGNEVWIANPGGPQIADMSSSGVISNMELNVGGGEPAIGALSGGTSTIAWATVLTTDCPSGKSSCSEASSLYSMATSGWIPVQLSNVPAS